MNILAVDQARHGAWAVFNYEEKTLVSYGVWDYGGRNYTFEQAVMQIENLIESVIHTHDVERIFFEDIQLRQNVQSFKRLAQLQGVLVNLCEKNEYQYGLVAPTQWQNYCKARGRTAKEIKGNLKETQKKSSKILSLQFVVENYGVETDNDNLSDAICIGHYVIYTL